MKPSYLAALLAFLPWLYLFSIGPAFWLDMKVDPYRERKTIFSAVYAPLFWLSEHSPALDAALEWYVVKWNPYLYSHRS